MTDAPVKLFVSYSWSSPEHEAWVIRLATELRESGVDVILDKWDLKEGRDAIKFMEQMVADPAVKKVIMVCDRKYAEKTDGRAGGVGTEAQIISPHIYASVTQDKFVAVVVEKDAEGKAYVPTYYRSRIYIDLSDEGLYAANFEQLLRWIYDKPLHVKPAVGKPPAFVAGAGRVELGTSARLRQALDAVRQSKAHAGGAVSEYFNAFAQNLGAFRIVETKEKQFDDQVVESIEQFLPYRNELIELFVALAQFRDTQETRQQIHRFVEMLLPYNDVQPGISSWQDWAFDNFKFMNHEIFLYLNAVLLRYERFDTVSWLLDQYYYFELNPERGRAEMVPYSAMRHYLKSLEHRTKRLSLRRISLHADLLEQRAKGSGLTFRQVMQADFVLYLRDALASLRSEQYPSWWPATLLYAERHQGAFEIFARAQSLAYFDKIKGMLGIGAKAELEQLLTAFKVGKAKAPSFDYETLNVAALSGFDKLATRP